MKDFIVTAKNRYDQTIKDFSVRREDEGKALQFFVDQFRGWDALSIKEGELPAERAWREKTANARQFQPIRPHPDSDSYGSHPKWFGPYYCHQSWTGQNI